MQNFELKLAAKQFLSQWRSGDLRVMMMALILAVTAVTAVGFFTNRVESALKQQGGMLLGGDLVVISDHAIPADYIAEAKSRQLQLATTLEFPSMVIKGEKNQLAEIKALGDGFPLRGDFTISPLADTDKVVASSPQAGSVWIEPRLANLLHLKVGDELELGERKLTVSAILKREPSRGGDMFSFAPRLMMNLADTESTGLIAFGSRIKYQLLLAGNPLDIEHFTTWIKPRLKPGERAEDIKTARPEIKSALEKSQVFLGLSAMVSVVLSVVAMWLASQPYVQRSQDTYALFRCFGASNQRIVNLMLLQTLFLALIGAVIGSLLGFIAQQGLALIAGRLFVESLPSPNYIPILTGFAVSILVMFAIMLPHLISVKNMSALRVLRRDLHGNSQSVWLKFLPVLVVLMGLMFWQANDLKTAGASIGGLILISAVAGFLAMLISRLLYRFALANGKTQSVTLNAIKLGLANLKRRLGLSIAQIIGFSLGLMVLMLLATIRGDLIHSWQTSLPADAPNRFIINIQPEQIIGVNDFFKKLGSNQVQVHPMVRGRLVNVNGRKFDAQDFKDERAKRLAEREFNLSWTASMQADNQLLEGHGWSKEDYGKPLLSLEKDLATTLNIKLGDQLTYDIAGTRLVLTVSSIRKVEWDSMRANFFAVTPPQVLDNFPASYMTSFHLPLDITGANDNMLNSLIQKFPNLTVIDVAAILQQVQSIMSKMTQAIGYVFIFSLLAGVAVLYAALVATREERVREMTLLRVLGASRKQVSWAILAEFLCIGFIAALVASLVATGLSFYISQYVLNIPYVFNPVFTIVGVVLATLLVPLASWLVISKYLQQSPKQLLNSI